MLTRGNVGWPWEVSQHSRATVFGSESADPTTCRNHLPKSEISNSRRGVGGVKIETRNEATSWWVHAATYPDEFSSPTWGPTIWTSNSRTCTQMQASRLLRHDLRSRSSSCHTRGKHKIQTPRLHVISRCFSEKIEATKETWSA